MPELPFLRPGCCSLEPRMGAGGICLLTGDVGDIRVRVGDMSGLSRGGEGESGLAS